MPASARCPDPRSANQKANPETRPCPLNITVVIPSYNRAHCIGRALDSVYNQSSAANEVIVIDDGSDDDSAELINQHYPQTRLIRQPNRGVSAARNAGIRAATCDWIALLDSDDEWLPDKLEAIRLAQSQQPDQILFHSDEIWVRDGVRVNPMNKHAKQGGSIFKKCLPLCVISPSAVVIQRSLFERVGLFNEALPACEDYDLWLRICHRFPVSYIDRPLINKYGGHEDQLSHKFWGMDRFRISALHHLMSLPSLQADQAIQTRRMLLKKLRILIKGARKHNNQQVLDEFEPLLKLYEQTTC